MLKRTVAGLIVAVVMASGAVAGPFEDGLAAYQRGDYATALKIWRPLGDQGDAKAQTMLGGLYDFGKGVAQDYAEAVTWYRLAAAQGFASAQSLLGSMSQFNLGNMYLLGHSVPQDYVLAHLWFNLAAARGDKDAAKNRDIVEELMTPDQIAEAQRVAREWKPTPAQ